MTSYIYPLNLETAVWRCGWQALAGASTARRQAPSCPQTPSPQPPSGRATTSPRCASGSTRAAAITTTLRRSTPSYERCSQASTSPTAAAHGRWSGAGRPPSSGPRCCPPPRPRSARAEAPSAARGAHGRPRRRHRPPPLGCRLRGCAPTRRCGLAHSTSRRPSSCAALQARRSRGSFGRAGRPSRLEQMRRRVSTAGAAAVASFLAAL
jgi:hypothetical protein